FLYAASNLGSMLGLLGYPFLIEPNLRLAEQSRYWAFGYVALAVAIIACASRLRHSTWLKGQSEETQIVDDSENAPTAKRRWKWIALAFVPSSLMLGVTQYISTDVAAVPLLWVVPLTLYLLTFTIVFARRPIIPHRLTLLLMPVAVGGMVVLMTLNITKPLLVAVAVHLAAFFFVAMMCHGEMAKDRPSVRYLTEFYLLMSVGGVLGGLFNAIVAPLLFPLVLEYHLVLVAAAFLYPGVWSAKSPIQRAWDFAAPVLVIALMLAAIALERKYGLTSSKDARQMIVLAGTMGCLLFVSRPLRFGLSLFAMLAFGIYSWAELRDILYVERSFFGVTRIESSNAGRFTDIFHGTTLHGMQSTEPENRMKPVSYYFPSGPIGVVLTHMERPVGANMAVIGLGSGTLATYGRPSEKWTYFEIDPVVEKVARDPRFFTYLRDSQAEVKVVLGDARMSLRDSTDQYDCIMLDAYSSDAVPIHLITKEALALYMKHLKPKGILMFHISNKHLDLEPVVHELARDAGLNAMGWRDTSITPEERSQRKVGSDWIMVYRSGANVSRILELGDWKPTKAHPGVGLWTDDFSSIWTIYNTQRIGG
ncbi:MAG TPA: fused MFS/spermidine synthase, partial [Fimbriimonadaceae bacterium]|nr:fused MFS/spermidine synthase [Fimbriimonadaceae bacterium]